MNYYLKKNWKICTVVCSVQAAAWGMQTIVQYRG